MTTRTFEFTEKQVALIKSCLAAKGRALYTRSGILGRGESKEKEEIRQLSEQIKEIHQLLKSAE